MNEENDESPQIAVIAAFSGNFKSTGSFIYLLFFHSNEVLK